MERHYDYLLVGAGLYNGVFAYFAGKAGKRISGRDLLDAVPLIFSDERMRRKAMKAELYI